MSLMKIVSRTYSIWLSSDYLSVIYVHLYVISAVIWANCILSHLSHFVYRLSYICLCSISSRFVVCLSAYLLICLSVGLTIACQSSVYLSIWLSVFTSFYLLPSICSIQYVRWLIIYYHVYCLYCLQLIVYCQLSIVYIVYVFALIFAPFYASAYVSDSLFSPSHMRTHPYRQDMAFQLNSQPS